VLYRLGRGMVRARWAVLALWGLALALALPYAPRAQGVLKAGFGVAETESRRGLALMEERFGIPRSSLTLVFHSEDLTADDPAYREAVVSALRALAEVPEVVQVLAPFPPFSPHPSRPMVSEDGRTVWALVSMDLSIEEALDRFPDLRARAEVPDPRVRLYITGGIAIFHDINRLSEEDLQRGERVTFPLVLVVLVVVFRSLTASLVPLLMGGVAVACTLALLYALGQATEVSIFALNIATLLGLGLAVDYSLLVVTRFREELAVRPVPEAVAVTVDRAGRALLFSALTSMVGFSGFLLFDFMMLRSLGYAGLLVILLSLLLAMSLLPALLGVLGPRVNALSLGRPEGPPREGGFWHRVAGWVMRHPWPVAVPLTLGLMALGTPFLQVRLGAPWASILPQDSPARQGWDLVARQFGEGALTPLVVLAQDPDGPMDPETARALYRWAQKMARDPRVEAVDSLFTAGLTEEQVVALVSLPEAMRPPQVSQFLRGDTVLIQIFPRFAPLSDETRALLREVRADLRTLSLRAYVTGVTAEILDAVDLMYRDFPMVVLYVVGAILVVLYLLFRSVALPVKAVLMNSASIFASYGALVWVFQEGHLSRLLGFQTEGYTEATVPILMFCILFGISMDYEVFLLSRVQEFWEETGDNTRSVALGLERTGRIITSAALILVVVTGAFTLSELLLLKALGLGMAVAILLDATVVRVLLVPALMRILGRWNWWAPRLLGGRPQPLP